MKILLLSSEFAPARGGIGTYAREIAQAATQLGAAVTVMAPDYGQDTIAADRAMPFEIRRFKGGLHSARDLPAKIALTRQAVGAGRFDIVHAADWPFFIPVALARGRSTARLVMTVHGTEINETQTPLKRMAIRLSGVFGPRTEVAANSRFTRTLFRDRFAIDERRIQAISLGVADEWFEAAADRSATREGLEISPDRIVIVTVARITRRKGHHQTLAALMQLPPELRRRMTWLVIGPGGESDYVDELRRLIAASDCDVRLLGALPDEAIRNIYHAADFFCLTGLPESSGRVEGFGLVYLEAGATGLPSVASDIGGVPDAVIANQSGMLVPPRVDEIAAAIAALARDTSLRARLSAGARDHARQLSWRRCAAETYGLPDTAGRPDVLPSPRAIEPQALSA